MKAIKVAVLLLVLTIGLSSCYVGVPMRGYHHHHHYHGGYYGPRRY